MESEQIFGSNIELPTLPGLKSDCEKELTSLMKEIDFEFESRYKELCSELSRLRLLCQAQHNELENAKSILMSYQQNCKQVVGEKKNTLQRDIEKLKEENSSLKKENEHLLRKAEKVLKNEFELENLKKNFQNKEEENSTLKTRLEKLDAKHKALQNNYQKLLNAVSLQQTSKIDENKQGKGHSSLGSVDTLIAYETEKFLEEEIELRNRLHSKIHKKIEDLERRLNEEIG